MPVIVPFMLVVISRALRKCLASGCVGSVMPFVEASNALSLRMWQ